LQITLKPADLRNLEELFRIERECFTLEAFSKEQIASLLRNPNATGLLVKVDGEVAGFVIGLIENHEKAKVGHVYTIDVAVKYRRKGIGIRLLKEIENTFVKQGVETSYLEVRTDNQAARRLYQKQGYHEIESLDNFYSTGVHGLRLKKQLKQKRKQTAH